MPKALDKAGRLLYRTLLKSGKTFDAYPATKALICRESSSELSEPLDNAVAAFLGGKHRRFFWPDPSQGPQSVVAAVRDAYRSPVADPTSDASFQALRYLTGVLNIAKSNGLLEPSDSNAEVPGDAATSPIGEEPSVPTAEVVSAPARGTVLIAHPCMPDWFWRTVVLLGDHRPEGGTMGVCINKPLGRSAGDFAAEQDSMARGADGGASSGQASATRASIALDLSNAVGGDEHSAHGMDGVLGDMIAAAKAMNEANGMDINEGELEEALRLVTAEDEEVAFKLQHIAQLVEAMGEDAFRDAMEEAMAAIQADIDADGDFDPDSDEWKAFNQLRTTLRERRSGYHSSGMAGSEGLELAMSTPLTGDPSLLLEGGLAGGASTPAKKGSDSGDRSSESPGGGGEEGGSSGASGSGKEGPTMKQLMAALPDSQMFLGGPVPQVNVLHALRALGGMVVLPASGNGGEEVRVGISAAAEEALEEVKAPGAAEKLRLLLGDSRWVPGQLDAEIASGCWMLCKVDSSTLDLFSGRCVPKAGATLLELQSAEWARVLSSLGPQYAELAKVPTDAWEQLQQLKT